MEYRFGHAISQRLATVRTLWLLFQSYGLNLALLATHLYGVLRKISVIYLKTNPRP